MKNTLNNIDAILSRNISGFHQYVLNDPVHLSYVSKNLCDMVGSTENELLSESDDLYARLVYPADAGLYRRFIDDLKSKASELTAQYRLTKKDGSILYVSDTMSCERLEDGTLVGYSVLTDITDVKSENDNLRFLNETIPCGFLKYTCEKQPKVTYINKHMVDFFRFPETHDGELDYMELYKNNIFLMIPMEERRKFALYLNRVYTAGAPVAGEMTLLRCDGTRAHVFGWVTKCVNEQGEEEFQSVCIDITERHHARKEDQTKRYLKALTDVYDKIFEYDLETNTVKCVHSNNSPMFKWLENMSIPIDDAIEQWISSTVVEENRDKVRTFFRDFRQRKLHESDLKPPQITYKAHSSSGEIKLYNGILLNMDRRTSLYCCRCAGDLREDALRLEYDSLKENMGELVMRLTEGAAAFRVTNESVKPLYASDNVCKFFGFTKDEWLEIMKKGAPLKQFVARSGVAYEEFERLLKNGEAEFTYFDLESKSEKHIKAICSQKSSPRYVMLYNIGGKETTGDKNSTGNSAVSIRTFGYFDVFVGDRPIAFRNKKSKELFALLVDRRGGYVSSEEAISFLWEDEPVSPVTLARYRKVALRLKNILEEYGISDVIESVDGKRRIVTEKVRCDLYDYLSGKEEFSQLFKGNYLINYSWGENTLAELAGDILR